jgi:multidrug resistance efflux pump
MHALVLFVGVLATTAQGAGAPATTKKIDRCLVVTMPTNGEAQVPAKEAGYLAALTVTEGQQVAAGDLLGRVDDTQAKMEHKIANFEYQAAKAEAESMVNIDYAVATNRAAKAAYKRAWDANQQVRNSVPAAEVDKLYLTIEQTQLAIEKARHDQKVAGFKAQVSEGKRDAAADAMERRQIKSPVDGRVVAVKKHVGEWVQPGETVAHVLRLDRLRVTGDLNFREFGPADVAGRPVIVTAEFAHGRETFTGKVDFVESAVRTGNLYNVSAEVVNRKVNGEWLLPPGLIVEMVIQLK